MQPPSSKNPLDRLADGPEPTNVEQNELADIDPDAHDTFEKTIRRRWYIDVAIGTFAAFSIEAFLWGILGWGAIIPVFLLLPYFHQKKWERHTDYGALARAKLAEDPHSEWKRQQLESNTDNQSSEH